MNTNRKESLWIHCPICRGKTRTKVYEDNMIPADAETLVICVYDNAIIVGEKKYLLESSIIGILEDKFITDKLHQ